MHLLQTNPIAAGNIGLLAVAQWNATTIDGDQGVVTTVNDAAGNVWLKAREYQEGATASQLGAVASMWYTIADNTLSTGQQITITFLDGSSAAFDASCSNVWVFSHSAANSYITVLNSTGQSVASTTVPGTLDTQYSTTGNYLRYRIVATQSTATTTPTTTAGWTATETHRATAAKALSMRGEWIIDSSSTKASAMTVNINAAHASVAVLFAEIVRDVPMGQTVL